MKKLILLFCMFIGWSVASAVNERPEIRTSSAQVAEVTDSAYTTDAPVTNTPSQSNPVIKIIYYVSAFMAVVPILTLITCLVAFLTGASFPAFELHYWIVSTLIWGIVNFVCKKILDW